jgi:hypothetical protein
VTLRGLSAAWPVPDRSLAVLSRGVCPVQRGVWAVARLLYDRPM